MDFPKAFAVLGPTAGGKTGLALRLAQRFPLEIISLDSALVYRGMDIGTAKPTAEELASVPHHLINIISPLQSYSAAEFAADCLRLCGEISARGRMPLIVGGTMMYFHALVNGLNDLPQADAGVRAQLQAQKAGQGVEGLYRRLCEVDAATAARLKPGDSQRIERALEVFLLTGRPLSDHLAVQTAYRVPLRLHTLVLFPQRRELLHEAIARRFRLMLEQGFLEEIGRLKAEYPSLTAEHNSMRCVGYRQAWDYLDGTCAYDAFVDAGIAAPPVGEAAADLAA